jgi:hypothetical protein
VGRTLVIRYGTLLDQLGEPKRDGVMTIAAELLGVPRGALGVGDVAGLLVLDRDIDDDIRALAAPALVIKEGSIVPVLR